MRTFAQEFDEYAELEDRGSRPSPPTARYDMSIFELRGAAEAGKPGAALDAVLVFCVHATALVFFEMATRRLPAACCVAAPTLYAYFATNAYAP